MAEAMGRGWCLQAHDEGLGTLIEIGRTLVAKAADGTQNALQLFSAIQLFDGLRRTIDQLFNIRYGLNRVETRQDGLRRVAIREGREAPPVSSKVRETIESERAQQRFRNFFHAGQQCVQAADVRTGRGNLRI